jgi:hypothetical protein
MTTAETDPTEATTAVALSYLSARLAKQYADLGSDVVARVVQAARANVGTSSRRRPVRDVVAEVDATARAALDRLRW